jgi:hypothetical protein
MTDLAGTFTINRADLAAKVIDGELIIIRLSDGTYYSMDNVGTAVWEIIEAHTDLPSLVRGIASRYGAAAADVENDVTDLLHQLVDEGLVMACENGVPASLMTPRGTAAYQKPKLNIYRDMGNLLALDPPTPGIDDLAYGDPPAR